MKSGASFKFRLQGSLSDATKSDQKATSKTHTEKPAFRPFWLRKPFVKVVLFVASLMLFGLAIMLMKEGAFYLAPWVHGTFEVANAANSLGFGWLFAYILMSGSPVAAAALAFLDAGAIDALSSLTMITGSRMGASFLVLLLGFFYVLKGRDRATSLSMGLLSLGVTGTTHLAALVLGIFMLESSQIQRIQMRSGPMLDSITDVLFAPAINLLAAILPDWGLFFVGLIIILVSFKLFDCCLPEMAIRDSHIGRISRLIFRPWVMFLLGAGVTLISMSVTLSLGILVPLSHRGYVRRENVIPYIMGACITTFVDTLLAAILLDNPVAFTVVLVSILSMTLISILILATCYHRYQRSMLHFVAWTTDSNSHLGLFIGSIFLVPLLLVLI